MIVRPSGMFSLDRVSGSAANRSLTQSMLWGRHVVDGDLAGNLVNEDSSRVIPATSALSEKFPHWVARTPESGGTMRMG